MQLSGSSRSRSGQGRARVRSGFALVTSLLISLLVLSPSTARAQRRVEVYKAKHRTAEELVPIAETVMADRGSVAVDGRTNSLVLVGDAGTIADALRLLADQDRAMRTVLLRYDTRRIRELATQGLQVNWTGSSGTYRLGNVRVVPESGSAIRASASQAVQRLVDSFSAKLRVVEGATARIETGTAVPYATQAPSGSSTEFVNATTGFESKARILSDGRVEVDLAAFARQLRPDGNLDLTGASTLLIVKPGNVVVVGSTSQTEARDRTNSLEGTRSDQLRDEQVLLLIVNVESGSE